MAEKTEPASDKKLRDAREKGQIAKSQDFPSAITFVVALGLTLYMGSFIGDLLKAYFLTVFQQAPRLTSARAEMMTSEMMTEGMWLMLKATVPISGLVAAAGCLTSFLVQGPVFSFEPFKPDFKKFNPVDNIKGKFKLKTLVELIKSILKVFGAFYIIYLVGFSYIGLIVNTPRMGLMGSADVFFEFTKEVITKVGLFYLVVAIADLAYQKYNFGNEMKMEKHEVKQEYKNSEGDPELKGKRKQMAKEIAFGGSPVKRAKAVVTNPTHLAIALGYEPENGLSAPFILAMGRGGSAAAIIREATQYGIPCIRNIELAHNLIDDGKLFEYVPESTYEAIAGVLQYLESLNPQPTV